MNRELASERGDVRHLWWIAGVFALFHIATNGQYGFHRDELQFLSDAKHLDWGFVAYPPLTPIIERISMSVFGLWMIGLRLASVLFQAAAIVLTGLMVREFSGARWAQMAAALAVALSPLPIFEATEFQYSSFDYLWWVLAEYCVIRLINTEDGRWWLGIGGFIGLGLETKYTMAFFAVGVAVATLLARERRWFASKWLWTGVALAVLLFAPNLIWQARHDWVSLTFLQHIHKRDVSQGRTNGFLLQQLWLCVNPVAAILWLRGLWWCFRQAKWRMLGWMYAIPLALFVAGRGRNYYFAPIYPMLIAAGAAQWWPTEEKPRRVAQWVWVAALFVAGVFFVVLLVPVLPMKQGGTWAMKINGDLREEIGWPELAAEVARIRDTVPPEQRDRLAVFAANYGERGAVDIFGKRYGLPRVISPTNSAHYWEYGEPAPERLVVLGLDRSEVNELFRDCELVGHTPNPWNIKNEETGDHPDIFLCGPPTTGWAEFWRNHFWFG